MKKIVIIGIISYLFFSLALTVSSDVTWHSSSFGGSVKVTHFLTYVDDDADPGWYNATQVKTIQEGIDNVTSSGTVYIWDGTYDENVIVDKTVSIIGNGSSVVTVDAGGTLSAINVTAEWVNVSGIRTNNSGTVFYNNAGIIIHGNYTNISNCNSSSNGGDGIIISNKLRPNVHDVLICNCSIYSNADDGIMLIMANNCDIVDNIVRSNVGDAIYPCWVESHNNSIHGNNCTDNNCSIYISYAKDNLIYNNYFGDIANTSNDGGNTWNVTKELCPYGDNIIGGAYLGGNYWADYTGSDSDADGLGDTELPHNCSGNITIGGDYHPLTYPNNPPAIEQESPSNSSSGVSRWPQLDVQVTDSDGDQSTVYWSTNASGDWFIYQTNSSVLNATVYDVNFSNASEYSTTYYWRVSANDTYDNTTKTFHFTTESEPAVVTWHSEAFGGEVNVTAPSLNWYSASFGGEVTVHPWLNTPSTIEQESPSNSSSSVDMYPTLSIRVNDSDGNQSTVYWSTNASGDWFIYQTNSSVLNATVYDVNFSNASEYSIYYWRVSANDTHDNTTKTFHFSTERLKWYSASFGGEVTVTEPPIPGLNWYSASFGGEVTVFEYAWSNWSSYWKIGHTSHTDINMDMRVNYLDTGAVALEYGNSGDPGWIPEDINDDGLVNYLDTGAVALDYGNDYR